MFFHEWTDEERATIKVMQEHEAYEKAVREIERKEQKQAKPQSIFAMLDRMSFWELMKLAFIGGIISGAIKGK